MRLLNYIILIFILLFTTISSGQAVASTPNQYESSWRLKQIIRDKLNTQERSNPIEYRDIKGSPYLDNNFKDGEYFLNGESQGHFYLRYNTYNDQIEILTDNSLENSNRDYPNFDVFLKLDNSKVLLDDKMIKPYDHKNDAGDIIKNYFIELNKTDKLTLLVRKRCVLTPAEKAPTPNQSDRAARFKIYNDYYILNNDEAYPKRIALKKRKFLTQFKTHENALKTFIKKNDIDLNNEVDLIKVTNYLSTL